MHGQQSTTTQAKIADTMASAKAKSTITLTTLDVAQDEKRAITDAVGPQGTAKAVQKCEPLRASRSSMSAEGNAKTVQVMRRRRMLDARPEEKEGA